MPLGFNKDFMNNPLFHLGMGLLSTPSKSLDPGGVSWGQGLQRGLLSYQNQLAQEGQRSERAARQRLAEVKLQAEREKLERQAQQEAARTAALPGLLSQLPQGQQEAVQALLAVDPEAGIEMATGLLTPQQTKLPGMLSAWVENPELVERYKRMEAAISGPRGTNVTVKMPSHMKPVEDKAVKYVMPDGSRPSPLLNIEEIVKRGGRVETPEEASSRKILADITAKEQKYEERLRKAEANYAEAQRNLDINPGAKSKRELDEAAHILRIARGQAANISGEPSDFVSRGMEAPGAVGTIVGDLLVDPLIKTIKGKPKRHNFKSLLGEQ